VNSVQPVSGVSAADDAAALKAAKDAGASFVVLGGYQSVENDLRITGQVIDVTTGQPVAGLKATGGQRDLFAMEDTIAAQVKRALPQPAPIEQPEMLKQPPANAPVAQAAAPAPVAPAADAMQRAAEAARRADQLMDDLERAIDRLRFRARWDDDFYGYYPRYYPYGYYPWYGYGQNNVAIIYNNHDGHGHGHHVRHHRNNGGMNRPSTPRPTPRNATTGNFNNFGRMVMQPVRR
jgi:hypothetical protein